MKTKLLLVFVTLLVLTVSVFLGCSKEGKESGLDDEKLSNENAKLSVKNSNLINNDSDYKSYIADFQEFLNRKKDIETIKKLMKLSSLNEADGELFAKALGFNSSHDFQEYAIKQSTRLTNVNTKYGILNNSKVSLSNFLEETLSMNKVKSSQDKVMIAPSDGGDPLGDDCSIRRRNCLVISTVAAVAGHIACGFVDAGTFGLGAFICHGAVTLGYSAANSNCLLDWEDCVNKVPA